MIKLECFLSIDYGGTNTKAIIYDKHGHELGVSSFETLRIENKTGHREVDLRKTWDAIAKSIKEVIKKSNIDTEEILGISCIGHGKGLYVLDKSGKEFRNGILSIDGRANELADYFEKQISELWPLTRQHIVGVQNPVLLRWIKENEKEIYDQIGSILSAKDFVRYKLTGKINQEFGDASGNHWINFETGSYDDRILDFFGINEMKSSLPPLVEYNEIVGGVSEEASNKTGLKVGTPVIGGMFDIDACAIGSGVLDNSTFSVISGTWNINTYPSISSANKDSGLMNSYFPDKSYLIEASSPTSAGNLNIMLKILMSDEMQRVSETDRTIYDWLEEFLANTDSKFSKMTFFPFLYGSNIGENAEACFFGISATTTKSEMIRAVYEGIIFAHKQHIEELLTTVRETPDRIRLSGGATNSPQWMQMFADILNIPVETVEGTELGGLGGTIACLEAVYGLELSEAVDQTVRVKERFEPNLEEYKVYKEKYALYQELIKCMQPVWNKLQKTRTYLEE